MSEVNKSQPKQPESPLPFEAVVSRMFNMIVGRNASAQDAKKFLVDWYNALSADQKAAFREDRDTVQNAFKRCEGAVDTIRQESQLLIHRYEG